MKDSVVLNVSAEKLFKIMKNSVAAESGQKKPDLKAGLSWTRKSNGHKTKVTLTDWQEPVLYGATFESGNVVLKVRYDLEPMDDKVKVTYTHDLGKSDWLTRRKEKAAVRKALSLLKDVEKKLSASK